MAANALMQLRNKYADDLEEILQCPVCFESLTVPIPMCTQGHQVCIRCQQQITKCPMCKSNFNGTRNYLAESLLSKFNDIKLSLIDPKNEVNKRILRKMVCVETQTDPGSVEVDGTVLKSSLFISEQSNNNNDSTTKRILIDYSVPPSVGKGKYPCRIGDCGKEEPHGRMIPHMRYYHPDNLIEEKVSDYRIYTKTWKIHYGVPSKFDQAINIPNMGFFFININIDDKGDLYGIVQIVNTRIICQQFEYKLDINISQCSTSYSGPVLAGRTATKKLHEKCLFINNSFITRLLKKKSDFQCTLTLTRT